MTQLLTPPPPKGYFYAVIPIDDWLLQDKKLPRGSFDLEIRRRRRFWFSQVLATVTVRADEISGQVSIESLDAAAVRLNQILEEKQRLVDNRSYIKNIVKETNQSV